MLSWGKEDALETEKTDERAERRKKKESCGDQGKVDRKREDNRMIIASLQKTKRRKRRNGAGGVNYERWELRSQGERLGDREEHWRKKDEEEEGGKGERE